MVSCERQLELRDWLCERIGYVPTKNIQCIGSVRGGIILGVVGFDGYNGASLQMHVAGTPGWLTRQLIWSCFDYAFNVCKVNMIIGQVPSGNAEAIRFNHHLGFRTRLELEGAHPDGSLILMTMERRECRYLMREIKLRLKEPHGQEVKSATAA